MIIRLGKNPLFPNLPSLSNINQNTLGNHRTVVSINTPSLYIPQPVNRF